jgi:hypothetical protein
VLIAYIFSVSVQKDRKQTKKVGNRKEEKEAKTLVKENEIKDNIYIIISVFHFKNRPKYS